MRSHMRTLDRVPTVLVIHSGAESFPANPTLDEGIREALTSRPDMPIDYYAGVSGGRSFPGEQASLAFADYIRRKYQGRRVDVVIAMTSTGLRFVLISAESCFQTHRSCSLSRPPGRGDSPRRRRHHRHHNRRCARRDAEARAGASPVYTARVRRRQGPSGADGLVRPSRTQRLFADGELDISQRADRA